MQGILSEVEGSVQLTSLLTSLDWQFFILKILFNSFPIQAMLMRSSAVLSLSLQLGFPGTSATQADRPRSFRANFPELAISNSFNFVEK